MKTARKFMSVLTSAALLFCSPVLTLNAAAVSESGETTERIILPNTLEQLVSDDAEFTDNSLIYSDCYQFAMEYGDSRDTLVVYGIPEEDCYGEWRNHITVNTYQFTYSYEDWFPAGENRSVYSGFEYHGVTSTNPDFTLEKNLDIRFFVDGEIPYFAETAEEASEIIGFDITPYIGSATIPDGEMYGDVNLDGTVDTADVIALNLYILSEEKFPLTSESTANSDCVRDNVINANDSTALLNYVTQLIEYDELGK